MAFRLKPDETLAKGVRRMARGQIDKALDGLTGLSGAGPEEVVHDARKRFKRVRALLRLVRDGLDRKLADREEVRFRDAGRPLSEVRDAGVLVDTFDKVVEQFGAPGHPETAGIIHSVLSDRKQAVCKRLLYDEKTLATVAATVQEARNDVKRWKIKEDEWEVLEKGLKRIYRKGSQAFHLASGDPSDESLHEWRKRTKDLWHALEILQPVRPESTQARGDQAHELADALGDDHDLAVLQQVVSDLDTGTIDQAAVEELRPWIDRRRAEHRQAALSVGGQVYADSPKVFVTRLGAYWRAWRSEIEAARFG